MKNLKISLLAILLLFAYVAIHSQTADEIIAKNIEAMGGKEKLTSITSLYIEYTMTAMGNESASSSLVLNGKGAKIKADVMGQTMVQCYTDKGGWMINPMAGSTTATPMTDEEYSAGKSQINIGESYFDYAKKGNKVVLVGKENVQNIDAFKLKVTTSDSISTFYYIDPANFNLIQSTTEGNMMGQPMSIISTYSDFTKTDFGYVLPNTMAVNYGDQFAITLQVKKVEFNKPVDPVIFESGNMD